MCWRPMDYHFEATDGEYRLRVRCSGACCTRNGREVALYAPRPIPPADCYEPVEHDPEGLEETALTSWISNDDDYEPLESDLVSITEQLGDIVLSSNSDHEEVRYERKRVRDVVGYANRCTIHPLSEALDDPHYSKGEWLVRWADPSSDEDAWAPGRLCRPASHYTWLPHAVCMEKLAPAVELFAVKVSSCKDPPPLSYALRYVSAVEDVNVKAIVAENDTHYWAEVALTPSFGNKALNTLVGRRFVFTYFENCTKPHIQVPKQELKTAYPEKVVAWQATDGPKRDLPEPSLLPDYVFVLVSED